MELRDERLTSYGVRLLLKRDDLIHPDVPGNKWRKLKYNLVEAVDYGHDTLLTFGGAYSNHIAATAAAGAICGLATVGVIRGEQHLPLNPVLSAAVANGMQLTYLDRTSYRAKNSPDILNQLRHDWGTFYLLPEGGSNELAVRGCGELPRELNHGFDVIACAVGTGGTLAGIAAGLEPTQVALGFSALRGGAFLSRDVAELQRRTFGKESGNWRIEADFHFGGFAKKTPELDAFIKDFKERHGLTLDWVYVAKMMFGIFALIERNSFRSGTRIVAVITG
jgi:1-aminocyclopropane-1-carboxylate deaminase